ncbi:MAG: TonB-dependent receptor [Desulfobacterium sp.]|nr:TonB-dependent receptor [Desulfobacterium sp.]
MRAIRTICLVIVAGFMALGSIPARALAGVEPETGQTTYRLDKVIVRDHPLREDAMVVTPEVTVINVDQFKKSGKIDNITDLLGEALGVNVLRSSSTPSQSEGVYIRGMDQSRYQVFMDGRPMRLHGSHGYFKMDWTTLPIDNVDTIEVIRGSHSLLYPFSMGGAINIITKKGKKTDDPRPSGSVKAGWGAHGDQSYSANITGGAFNTIGYSFAAGHREGDGFLRGNDYDTDNVAGRISLYLPTNGTVTYGVEHIDTVTGYALINDPDDPASNYNPDYPIVRAGEVDTFTHDNEGKCYDGGKSHWEKQYSSQSLLVEQPLSLGVLRAMVYEEISKRDRYAHLADGTDTSNYKEEYTGGLSLDYLDVDLLPNHALSAGGDYRDQGTTDNKDFYSITSLYLQDVWELNPKLSLTYGTRWYQFESDSFVFGSAPLEKTRRKEEAWCPKARLDYRVDDTLALYAAVSREMRLP